jgi:hypothetical protein
MCCGICHRMRSPRVARVCKVLLGVMPYASVVREVVPRRPHIVSPCLWYHYPNTFPTDYCATPPLAYLATCASADLADIIYLAAVREGAMFFELLIKGVLLIGSWESRLG